MGLGSLGTIAAGSRDDARGGEHPPGIYYGWVGGDDSRFQLLGAPCPLEDSLQAFQLAGGHLSTPVALVRDDLDSGGAGLDLGQEKLVTTLRRAALARLVSAAPTAADPPRVVEFTRLSARCRSWREQHARIGSAAVESLREDGAASAVSTPRDAESGRTNASAFEPVVGEVKALGPGASDLAARSLEAYGLQAHGQEARSLEAHVVPIPGRTPVLAAVILWNRSTAPITITALRYAPPAVTTDRVLAAAGSFEHYNAWQDHLFGRSVQAPPRHPRVADATALGLQLLPEEFALIAFDRGSFVGPADLVAILSYPVVDYRTAGTMRQLPMTAPLYATLSRADLPRTR